MDIAKESNGEKLVKFSPWSFLVSSMERLKVKAVKVFNKLKKIGKDDPRRIFHSLKVGLALTLVSTFYYVNPLFNGFGVSAMWALLTVVVVMEYTVGGTLGKGLNRAFATFLAASLGLGAHHIAALAGDKGEPILLSLFVFLFAAGATFSRFIPEIKARYDYGVTIFILTFSLVTISSYRVEELVKLAHQRLSTIALGVTICLFTSILVFPVWAGEDLHKLVASNLEKLASFLEVLGSEYFEEKVGSENLQGKSLHQAYKSVLNTKPTEEFLANCARWEPGHGHFRLCYPWGQYLKIGAFSRQCVYSIETLSIYITALDRSDQAATDMEFRKKIQSTCVEMSCESAKALSDLASSIRSMTSPSSASLHMANALAAAAKLETTVPASSKALADVIRSATVASLLTQVVKSALEIAGAVDELARTAKFKKPETETNPGRVCDGETTPHVAIDIN